MRLAYAASAASFLGFFDGFIDGADHVEGRFRQVIVFAFEDAFEAFDGVFERHEHARRTGKDFSDVERLRQEALDLPRAATR